MLHEQAAPALAPVLTTSLAPQFPTSVLIQELRDDFKPLLHINKTPQVRFLGYRPLQHQFDITLSQDHVLIGERGR